MYISVQSICNSPDFKDVKVIAGKNGLHRNINKVSVADLKANRSEKSYYEPGCLFISSLEFFEDCTEKEKYDYFDYLIESKTAGLIYSNIKPVENYISDALMRKCDEADYPVLVLQSDDTYASIMATINKFIAFGDLTASYNFILQQIQTKVLSKSELHTTISRLFPGIDTCLVALCFDGKIISDVMFSDFIVRTLNSASTVYAGGPGIKYYILAGRTENELTKHLKFVLSSLQDYFDIKNMGMSRIQDKYNIKDALDEANDAFCTARRLDKPFVEYTPLSTFQLVSLISDSHEAHAYYDEFLSILSAKCTDSHLIEVMDTLRAYIACHGDYKVISAKCHQHENTVRYRINKIKEWLDLEDDPVTFHEICSIICKLDSIYSGK